MVMTRMSLVVPVLCAIWLSGCATMAGPPEDLLQRVPVVEIGQPEPADKHYVLLIRGGKPVPIHLTIKGPLFVSPGQATAQVLLSQSLYIYKEWSSLDGINWTRQGFEGAASIGLAPKGGIVDIRIGRAD
jgi:predicted small secreted protein